MKKEISLLELPDFVKEFLNNLTFSDKANVIGLSGDLGSGKTTFVKEVAKQLEIKEEITSPTFTIMQKYNLKSPHFAKATRGTQIPNFKNLVHIDLYRLEESNELKILDLENELKNPENLIFIEWFDKFEEIKPDIKIYFEHKGENSREIEIIYESK